MDKDQTAGVQCLPSYSAVRTLQILRIVEKISEQRVSDMFHMDADLVCSPGFEAHEGRRNVSVAEDSLIMSNCVLTVFVVHLPHDRGVADPRDRCVDRA